MLHHQAGLNLGALFSLFAESKLVLRLVEIDKKSRFFMQTCQMPVLSGKTDCFLTAFVRD